MGKELKYKRILLKLSGEALAGDKGYGIDPLKAEELAVRVKHYTQVIYEMMKNGTTSRNGWCRNLQSGSRMCANLG